VTTSVGRLLDACAAMCGICPRISYEGQAAIAFESLGQHPHRRGVDRYPVAVVDDGDSILIDPRPLVLALEREVAAGRAVEDMSAATHFGLVYATTLGAHMAAQRRGIHTIVLSGGVFQNVLLVETLSSALADKGYRVLVPRSLPPNDGGLAYGQAAVAASRR
jgi:hydrogenase maturation protein HypF